MIRRRTAVIVFVVFYAVFAFHAWKAVRSSKNKALFENDDGHGDNHPQALSRLPHTSSNPLCNKYNGVLWIQGGNEKAASGTLFFAYIINHIIYAEKMKLLPYVYFLPQGVCYDPNYHAASYNKTILVTEHFTVERIGVNNETHNCFHPRPKHQPTWPYPGKVSILSARKVPYVVQGNGIWETYFEPVVEEVFQFLHQCPDRPTVWLGPRLVFPGLHLCAPWSVRAFDTPLMPPYLRPTQLQLEDPKRLIDEWFRPKRDRASRIVKRYIRPKPWLLQAASIVNRIPNGTRCLGMHIRMTDKGDGRSRLPLEIFAPFASLWKKYTPSSDYKIYVATDDATVVDRIRSEWLFLSDEPKRIRVRYNTLQSKNDTEAVFDVFAEDRHRANSEALAEIYAMAQCDYFVYGYSAMAEAVLYTAWERLQNRSYCPDMNLQYTRDQFEADLKEDFSK